MKNIEVLIDNGGEIALGQISTASCGVSTSDNHSAVAIPVRRDGEMLNALLKRLDKVTGRKYEHNETVE